VIFFEGTYTHSFSGNPEQTPRYDYNQVLYKLDLDDPRLALPVPVYALPGPEGVDRFGRALGVPTGHGLRAAFFAPGRPRPGAVPVYDFGRDEGHRSLHVGKPPDARAVMLFFALPADTTPAPAGTVPLYEFVHSDGKRRAYATDKEWSRPGFRRSERPLCLVWRNPLDVTLPRE